MGEWESDYRLLMACCLVHPRAAHFCHLQALTLETSVPHPLSDALPIGDSSPMCQSLCHCLDKEQEPVVEGRWDGIHLQGPAQPSWGRIRERYRLGCCGEDMGGAGSLEEDGRKHPHMTERFCY